jgi:hypothetical protein
VATPAQIRANRLNALRSTGPRTAAGKARSSQNARIHGFRSRTPAPPPFDDPAFADLLNRFWADLQPANPAEEALVVECVDAYFRLLTLYSLEAGIFQAAADPPAAIQEVAKLLRYMASADLAFHRSFRAWMARRYPKPPRGRPKIQKFAPTNPISRQDPPKTHEYVPTNPISGMLLPAKTPDGGA